MKKKDGQQDTSSSPSWAHIFQPSPHMKKTGFTMYMIFNTIFCDWERQKSQFFLFPAIQA
jgi:hypothetical protein